MSPLRNEQLYFFQVVEMNNKYKQISMKRRRGNTVIVAQKTAIMHRLDLPKTPIAQLHESGAENSKKIKKIKKTLHVR